MQEEKQKKVKRVNGEVLGGSDNQINSLTKFFASLYNPNNILKLSSKGRRGLIRSLID